MRRLLLTAALAGAMFVPAASVATAVQHEEGLILAPNAGRVSGILVEGCPGVVDASLGWAAGASLLTRFDVDAATWGEPFTLQAGNPFANLDIGFRVAGSWTRFESEAFGGESGTVPPASTEAVVCLSVGLPTSFFYDAG